MSTQAKRGWPWRPSVFVRECPLHRAHQGGVSWRAFFQRFAVPAFDCLRPDSVASVDEAWDAYRQNRKAPKNTSPPAAGFADPAYALVDWWRHAMRSGRGCTRSLTVAALAGSPHQRLHRAASTPVPARCRRPPAAEARATPSPPEAAMRCEVLDLSRLASEYGKQIHPCKACVSTSTALCHWPCSCYPNHAHGADQRLDGRDLSALGRRARHLIALPGALVPGAGQPEADDGPPGLRRRRQPRPDHHAAARTRPRQGARARGMAVSAASGRARVLGRGARRRGRRRRPAPMLTDWLTDMGLVPAGTAALLDATSATTSRMRPATPSSTRTPACSRRCATRRAR